MANKTGRARDSTIDDRILAVAARHLAEFGYDGMSVHGVAADAGTTRQALYRRWATKAELAAAVVAQIPGGKALPDDGDPFRDLVTELEDFRSGVSRPGRMSLVGTMLQDGTDDDVRARYRENVVAPRRERIRRILERGELDGDVDIVVTMATGSWYARALAGEPVPDGWAERTAKAIWRAAGGAV
ncbi:TetR/AcrR family transcriptional regulator [Actinomycetes bacterium M1A6_2h]